MRAAAAGGGHTLPSIMGSKKGLPLTQRHARKVHTALFWLPHSSFYTSWAAECSRSWIWWECGHLHAHHHLSTRQLVCSSWGWGSALPVLPLPMVGAVQPLSLGATVSSAERPPVMLGVLGGCGVAPQTRSTRRGLLRVCCLKCL